MTETAVCLDEWLGQYESPDRQAAVRLCQELADGSVRPPAVPPRRGLLGWLDRLFFPDPAAEVDRHRGELAVTPLRPLAVLRFARFLERRGHDDLCTVPWSLLYRLCPDDPEPAVALAGLFLARGRRADRPTADRLHDYARFFRYAGRALAAVPPDHPVRAWHTAAGVEVTLLKGNYRAG